MLLLIIYPQSHIGFSTEIVANAYEAKVRNEN